MTRPDSRASHRPLAVVFGILVLFLIIYADLQARLRRLSTTDLAQTVPVETMISHSKAATGFLIYRELMTFVLVAGMIIIAAIIVSIVFTLLSRKRPESERRRSKRQRGQQKASHIGARRSVFDRLPA